MVIDEDATRRLVEIIQCDKISGVQLGVLQDEEINFRLASYQFDQDSRKIRIDISASPEGVYRFLVFRGHNIKGSLAFDISRRFENIWYSSINFSECFGDGYGSFIVPFFKFFLLEHGCQGYDIGVRFNQDADRFDQPMINASERLFKRYFFPTTERIVMDNLKEVWGVV